MIDKMLTNRFLSGNRFGRFILKITGKLLWFLPHGIVIDHEAAIRLIAYQKMKIYILRLDHAYAKKLLE